jgi:hypothetical protein
VCNMVGKTLESLYSTFFTWCCFHYVHFWELYLSCVYCLCIVLGVFVVSYVYLLYFLCVFVVLCVYCCSYFRCRSAGWKSVSGHVDTGFSWFPCVCKRLLRWFLSFQVDTTCLSCSSPDFIFLVTFFKYLCTCKITTATG